MTPNLFSSTWTAVAPAVGNHLWQSTWFVVAVWLLTLLWRKNQARARYWLWLAASLKFLLPFSLLISLGSRLAVPHVSTATQTGLYGAIEQMSQPFTQPAMPVHSGVAPASVATSWMELLPSILMTAWLCGLVVVLLVWYARWRRISALTREATPLHEGREVEILHRLQSRAGIGRGIRVLLSRASVEPGIFGIFRPVLLWPEKISERLGDEHLEAILAHELWHVRRRDNLAAAVHMVVEAIFWFHPLVWWLGARLIEERERACDQEVLARGSQRHVYAESILKTCEFCVGAPLACVSGVTGADLKKRIVQIMTQRMAEKLSFSRKLLLAMIAALAIAAPVVFGLLHAPQVRAQSTQTAATLSPLFEVASIKPNKTGADMVKLLFTRTGMSAENFTVHGFIRTAYAVQEAEIAGEPGWLRSEKYDVEARVAPAFAGEHYSASDRRLALQQLLADRFKLKFHREIRQLPVYELVVARNGPKFQESKPGDTYSSGAKRHDGKPIGPGIWILGRGDLAVQGEPLSSFISLLSRQLDRPIVDQTGLKGGYDFTLKWTPEDPASAPKAADGGQPASAPESSGPSIFVAV
ncbi:MAG TPA: M56 family metallopeptidase, partial [Candidatus Angelobacter sp.]